MDREPDNKVRLAEAVRRQRRRNSRPGLMAILAQAGISGSVVGDQRQLDLVENLKRLPRGKPKSFGDCGSAIVALRSKAGEGLAILLAARPEEASGVVVDSTELFGALLRHPLLMGLDGLILMSVDGNAAAELDYHEGRADSPTDLTTYGLWADAPEVRNP